MSIVFDSSEVSRFNNEVSNLSKLQKSHSGFFHSITKLFDSQLAEQENQEEVAKFTTCREIARNILTNQKNEPITDESFHKGMDILFKQIMPKLNVNPSKKIEENKTKDSVSKVSDISIQKNIYKSPSSTRSAEDDMMPKEIQEYFNKPLHKLRDEKRRLVVVADKNAGITVGYRTLSNTEKIKAFFGKGPASLKNVSSIAANSEFEFFEPGAVKKLMEKVKTNEQRMFFKKAEQGDVDTILNKHSTLTSNPFDHVFEEGDCEKRTKEITSIIDKLIKYAHLEYGQKDWKSLYTDIVYEEHERDVLDAIAKRFDLSLLSENEYALREEGFYTTEFPTPAEKRSVKAEALMEEIAQSDLYAGSSAYNLLAKAIYKYAGIDDDKFNQFKKVYDILGVEDHIGGMEDKEKQLLIELEKSCRSRSSPS